MTDQPSTSNGVGMKLITGSKRYSSWSMRPWIFLGAHGIDFEDHIIRFRSDPVTREFLPETKQQIDQYSPNRKVPALHNDSLVISESLAICEYVAELFPDIRAWPASIEERALAKSLCLEVVSGFTPIKLKLPFVGDGRRKSHVGAVPDALKQEIDYFSGRVLSVLSSLGRSKELDILDAMLTPMMLRLHAYGIEMEPDLCSYFEHLISFGAVQDWIDQASSEQETILAIECIFDAFPFEASVAHKL